MSAQLTREVATPVRVQIPSPLRSYTSGAADVAVAVPLLAPESPPTIQAVLAALDGAFPGIRFRIVDEQGAVRPHIKLFVGGEMTRNLRMKVPQGSELMIVAALSGG
jgi:molybdopterin synthase sulfur carrier subunit